MTFPPAEQDILFRQSAAVTVEKTVFTVLYRDPYPKDAHRAGPMMHAHGIIELHLITKGVAILQTEDETLRLRQGDCVLIGKNTLHLLKSDQGEPLERFELQISYEQQPDRSGFLHYLNGLWVCRWQGRDRDVILELAAAIVNEISQKGLAYRDRLRAYLTLFLTELMRFFLTEADAAQPPPEEDDEAELSAADAMAIDNILTCDLRITAEELAARLSISKRQLYRILNRYQSGTFKQKLVAFRVEAARRLLEDSDLPLSEVAQRVGYENAASFCKAFKKKTGVSPGAYRKALL